MANYRGFVIYREIKGNRFLPLRETTWLNQNTTTDNVTKVEDRNFQLVSNRSQRRNAAYHSYARAFRATNSEPNFGTPQEYPFRNIQNSFEDTTGY